MGTSNLHLVDEHGQPLPAHIIEAVEQVEPGISRRFSRRCDPAQFSNSIEAGARRIAQYEKEHGQLRNVRTFTGRTLFNAAISLVRFRSREESLSAVSLRKLPGIVDDDNFETQLIRAQEQQAFFSTLSAREQEYLLLRKQELDDRKIAKHWSLSKNALAAFKHRLKRKLAAKGIVLS